MTDITMCKGNDKGICEKCYRKTETPNPLRQSYFMDIPMKADDTCDEFINMWRFRDEPANK